MKKNLFLLLFLTLAQISVSVAFDCPYPPYLGGTCTMEYTCGPPTNSVCTITANYCYSFGPNGIEINSFVEINIPTQCANCVIQDETFFFNLENAAITNVFYEHPEYFFPCNATHTFTQTVVSYPKCLKM